MTETITKFPLRTYENYTNKKIKNFLVLTSKDKINIKQSFNPESRSKI